MKIFNEKFVEINEEGRDEGVVSFKVGYVKLLFFYIKRKIRF